MDHEELTPRRRPMGATGLQVMDALAEAPSGLGLRELSRQIGLDPGQAHRLLKTLEGDGWVVQDGTKGLYRITGRLLSVAGRLLRHLDLREVASPIMQRLKDETGETVGLVELRGETLICIHRVLSDQPLSVGTQIGDRIPFEGSATGRAIQAAWLRHGGQTRGPFTPLPDLSDRLVDTVASGYAVDDQEFRPDVRAVAAAILDLEEVPVGAIFVSAPAARTPLERTRDLGRLTLAAAANVSQALGYPARASDNTR